jgi:hypothetical protein
MAKWKSWFTLEVNVANPIAQVVLLAVLVCNAHAGTIVNTFGTGQSFLSPPGETIGGGILRNDPPPNIGVTQAFGFTPASAASLSQIDLAMQYFFLAGRATGPANLDVSIATNSLGQPGTLLETIHLTNVLGSVPFQPGIVSAVSVSHPLLQAGTSYWLVVAPPDLANTAFDWLISPLTTLSIPSATRLGSGPWITYNTNQPLAFDVSGTAAVPEPNSLFMMLTAVGAIGLLTTGRRGPR